MTDFSSQEQSILVQYAIKKYENEDTIIEKLKVILSEKEIQRNLDTLIGTVRIMLDAYNDGRIDRVYLIFNEFVNSMTQTSTIEQLIPLVPEDSDELSHHWDYLYESGSEDVMEQLLTRYIESLVYQGVVENIACEQAARMVAMKSASDNAGTLIEELQLVYNKARQAAITQELSEIVAGAAAV